MSTTMDLFAGIEARDRGMELAESSRSGLVAELRSRLAYLARQRASRTANADDFEALLGLMGKKHSDLGNAAGSIFHSAEWEWTGEFVPSRRVSNHGRFIRTWRLK